jgi:hypothetical protein
MITIELGTSGSEKQAQKIHDVLHGRTYYNFQVNSWSDAGNWPVSVSTDYMRDGEAPEESEVMGMIMFCLASSLR